MDSLRALKAMKETMKKEAQEATGSKKYVTKAQLEAAKLLKVRGEEQQERQEKVCNLEVVSLINSRYPTWLGLSQERKRKLQEGDSQDQASLAKQVKADHDKAEVGVWLLNPPVRTGQVNG